MMLWCCDRKRSNQCGSALLMLLVGVTLLGLMAGMAGTSWRTLTQQAKEADLLWKGNQIRTAIGNYYETAHGGGAAPKLFPSELEALLKDPRFLETRRYLRKLYPDPMTGEPWALIKGPAGRIIGVRSTSDKKPFKQAGFSQDNRHFTGKESYQEWAFVYEVDTQQQQTPSEPPPEPSTEPPPEPPPEQQALQN